MGATVTEAGVDGECNVTPAQAAKLNNLDLKISTLKALIDAIEVKLDSPDNFKADVSSLAAALAVAGSEIAAIEAKLDNPDNFKADVTALALEATIQKTYIVTTNRTVGSKTLTLANTEYTLLELNGEAANTAYKGRLKIRLPVGYTYIMHKYTKVNSNNDNTWKEIGSGVTYNTASGEANDDGYRFEDTETIKYTIECATAGIVMYYEYNYASRGE